MGFQDYIGVDNRDLYKLNTNELRKLNLDYISTSAAANPLFDMKILYLALKVGIPNVLMPKQACWLSKAVRRTLMKLTPGVSNIKLGRIIEKISPRANQVKQNFKANLDTFWIKKEVS